MRKSTNAELSFKDIDVFVGLDVHKKSWKVTIRSMGLEIETYSMSPSAERLAQHLKTIYPGGIYHSAYEAGFCGFWIHAALLKRQINNMVIHAADVPTTNKEKVTKTDKIDSRKIAKCLENGSLNPLYVPSIDEQQLRSLVRLRSRMMSHQTRLKNRIKGHLHFYGIELDDERAAQYWSGAFIAELETLAEAPNAAGTYMRLCLNELRDQRCRLAEITRELRLSCRNPAYADTMHYLLSVPGVGFVTAVTLLTELIDIDRFKGLDELCAYVGMVPSEHSSGDKTRRGGLSPRKNRHLKHLIIESAWVAMRRDPELTQTFARLTTRMKKTDAIIRICKKLLNRIRYVWKNQTPYQIQASSQVA